MGVVSIGEGQGRRALRYARRAEVVVGVGYLSGIVIARLPLSPSPWSRASLPACGVCSLWGGMCGMMASFGNPEVFLPDRWWWRCSTTRSIP